MTEEEYQQALDRLEALWEKRPAPGTQEARDLHDLAAAIEAHEASTGAWGAWGAWDAPTG